MAYRANPLLDPDISDFELSRVQLFLRQGYDVNDVNTEDGNCTPLLYVARNSIIKYEYCQLLLFHGADVNAQYAADGYCTALLYAVREDNPNIPLIALLLAFGADANAVNMNDGNCSALLYCAQKPDINYRLLGMLLNRGANVDAENSNDGNSTALIYATRTPNLSTEVIELLLMWDADTNATNFDDGDCTALFYAVKNPNRSYMIIELLLKYKANVHNALCGRTALNFVVREPTIDLSLVKLFLDYSRADHFNNETGIPCRFCLEALKYIILLCVKQDPDCISDSYTCESLLGTRCFNLFSPHFSNEVLKEYLDSCVLEIQQIQRDGIYPLLIDSPFIESPVIEPSFSSTRTLANRLLAIFRNECFPLYSEVIRSNMSTKRIIDLLGQFSLRARLSFDRVERTMYLNWVSTLRIVKLVNLKDMLHLVAAFFGSSNYRNI